MPRKPDPIPELEPFHIRLLSFIAAQHAVSVRQLAEFLGIYRSDLERFLPEFEEKRWIDSKQFLTGDDVRIWLRNKGYALAKKNYNSAPAHPQALAHWSAITDARLWMEEHFDVVGWYSEGNLRSIYPPGPTRINMPDAVAKVAIFDEKTEIKTEYYIAIEAELSKKSPSSLHRKMKIYEENYTNFAKVIYFVTPEIEEHFSKYKIDKKRYPKLEVVPLGYSVIRELTNPEWAIETDPSPEALIGNERSAFLRSLSESHLILLRLFADQRAIPMDQIAEFLKKDDKEYVERLILNFVGKGLLQRARPFPDQPIWVWPTRLGTAASQRGISKHKYSHTDPSLGGLELIRFMNSIRIEVEAERGAWVSERKLRQIFKLKSLGTKGGILPQASYELDSKRHFVDVFVSSAQKRTLEKCFNQRLEMPRKGESDQGDRIIWYYNKRSRSYLEKFHKEIQPWLVQKYGKEEADLKFQIRPLPNLELNRNFSSLVPPDIRTSVDRNACVTMWRGTMQGPTIEVFPISTETIESEAIEAVAKAAQVQYQPRVIAAWRRCRPMKPMYLLETDVGMFRVSRSKKRWRADESINDEWYVKVEAEKALLRQSSGSRKPIVLSAEQRRNRVKEPKVHVIDDVLWAEVEHMIPPIQFRSNSTRLPFSDRAILSGIIWRLRNEKKWWDVPAELEFGTAHSINERLRAWEELGVWADVQKVLEFRLPDGELLNWTRLMRLKDRPPPTGPRLKPHQLALLAELEQDPEQEFTIKEYGAIHGRSSSAAGADLGELAELNLLIGTRRGLVFTFRAAPDLTPRRKRLKILLPPTE